MILEQSFQDKETRFCAHQRSASKNWEILKPVNLIIVIIVLLL